MRLELQIEPAEHALLSSCAKEDSLPLAAWCRFSLMKLARDRKPMHAAPKPYVRPGPKSEPVDAYLAKYEAEGVPRFASGQRRFDYIVTMYRGNAYQVGRAHDEGLHAAYEKDLRAAHAAGVKVVKHHLRIYLGMPATDDVERSIPDDTPVEER